MTPELECSFLHLTKPSLDPNFKKEWMFISGVLLND